MSGVQRKTTIPTIFGDIEVSSIRGDRHGLRGLNETCVFLPEGLACIKGYGSEVVGMYDDHEAIVDAIRFTTIRTGEAS